MPFIQTLRPLILAALVGVVMLDSLYVITAGSFRTLALFFLLLLYMAPFVFGAAALFVVPVFALWPASRLPSLWIAAVWGGVASYASFVLLYFGRRLNEYIPRDARDAVALALWAAPGAASGLLYAWLARRRLGERPNEPSRPPT
jgi:hypothetical protein